MAYGSSSVADGRKVARYAASAGSVLSGAEVVGEGERQAENAGHLGAVVARAEQPERGHVAEAGHGGDRAERVVVGERAVEVGEQFAELRGEVVGRSGGVRRSAAAVS